jgi:hypothetical protein
MKTIRQFLDAGGSKESKPRQKGKFSDWLPFHPLNLKGNALQFVEVRVLGLRGHKEHECVEIPASPGVYAIECRGVQFGSDTRIAGLRAYPAGLDPKRGKKLKEIPVDLGGIAVVDIVAVHASMQQDAGRYEAWLEQLLYDSDEESLASIAKWNPTKTEIPYVDGGFGDGSYPVFQLMASGKVIGLEVEFIKRSDKYPS